MEFYYLKLAIRNLKNHLFVNVLNIMGLATGLAVFLILIYYINNESTFDQFHKDVDNIYRVESSFLPIESKNDMLATSSFGYGPAMKTEMPEVKEYCRINLFEHEKDVKFQDKIYREKFVVLVDSNFFTFFSFNLLEGDPYNVLNKPHTMAISESAARKYFGNENPIGKVMEIKSTRSTFNYTVTGLFKDFPESSHFQSGFLLSYPYANNSLNYTWYMHEAYLYVKTNSEAEKNAIVKKFPEMAEKYKTRPGLRDKKWMVELIPLADIHLNEPKTYELENKGNRRSIYFLSLIAIIIILIAWINYINISTTHALERIGEISIRKVNGARFHEILKQFFSQAFVVNIFAFVLALCLIYMFHPLIANKLLGSQLSGIWDSSILWIGSTSILLAGVLVTGLIPSLFLSKIKTANILRNKSTFKAGTKKLREYLVITQFVTSVILIVGTLTVEKQISFMMGQDLGVDIKQTLVFKTPTNTPEYNQKLLTLKREIKKLSGVNGISQSSVIPGRAVGHLLSNRRVDTNFEGNKLSEMLRVDYDFVTLYGLEILAGRNFKQGNENDLDGLLLTETAAKLLGFRDYEKAINREILLEGQQKRYHILGIIKDYHHVSVKENFRPIILFMAREHRWIRSNYFSVKVAGNSVNSTIKEVKKQYSELFPDASFEYFFLDDFFNNQYQNEKKFERIFFAFTWLGIFIVCLGIIGLSGFILLKKTKEIGVRKVNGANTSKIIFLLAKDLIRWNIYGLIIATPIAYFLMVNWLENFACKTEISWWIFALAGSIALIISLVTVSWQSYRAASRNPVEALRYE